MGKLAFFRLFRCLVCLVLICCLLINISPIRTSATLVAPATAAVVVGISPAAAIAGILVCLGVWFVASGSFNDLVTDVLGAISPDYYANGYIEGLKYNDTVYVPETLVKDVNDILYSYDSLNNSDYVFCVNYSIPNNYRRLSSYGFSSLSNYESVDLDKNDFNYWYLGSHESSSGTVLYTIFSNSPVVFTEPSVSTDPFHKVHFSGQFVLFASSPGSVSLSTYDYSLDSDGSLTRNLVLDSHYLADIDSIISSGVYDISVAEAAPDLDDDEEYQAWKARRLFRVIEGGGGDEDPDDDDDDGLRVLAPYYPVPGAENAENLPDSQEQAWAGNRQEDPDDDPVTDLGQSSEVSSDPNYDPNTTPSPDPDPNPDPSPDPDPGLDPEPAPNPQPDTSLSGTVLEPFTLPSLRNFFPFCIPFDLYDMLAAFVAEPEAPVFTFATGFLGKVFTVDIDLSPWNSVAKTVRSIQLCICIVGLAFATRKFIKW